VLVGPDEVAFTVHENFICAKPKFFQAACRKEWSKGAQKLIRLPEVEPGVFRSYLNWVYTGDLAVDSTKDDPVNPKNTKYSNFLKLYVLGDTLDDLSLRNSTTEILVRVPHDEECDNHSCSFRQLSARFSRRQAGSLRFQQVMTG
jgi:hypothetical protein